MTPCPLNQYDKIPTSKVMTFEGGMSGRCLGISAGLSWVETWQNNLRTVINSFYYMTVWLSLTSAPLLVIVTLLVVILLLTALVAICKKGSSNHLAAQDCYENNKEIAHKIPGVALKCKGWVWEHKGSFHTGGRKIWREIFCDQNTKFGSWCKGESEAIKACRCDRGSVFHPRLNRSWF